jgi:ribonucleoside-triphosphate reductase
VNLTQSFQFLSKYSRWREEDQRRETYPEAIARTTGYLADAVYDAAGYRLKPDEFWELTQSMLRMEAFPSLRMFQMAGPAAERCNVSIYNCAYRAVDSLSAFSEILYILMQGTGCGFSVEKRYVDRLPSIRKRNPTGTPFRYIVPDDTDGWCDALGVGLRRWTFGLDVDFDLSEVRPAGSRLATKGGRASGPEPLKSLLDFCRKTIAPHWHFGGRLSPLDVHDIVCMIGEIVRVGGVRRAALLSLSDLGDTAMRDAKAYGWWDTALWRSMANNSAVYEEKPSWDVFTTEWEALRESGSGERGIWNRGGYSQVRNERRRDAVWGVNPCGEIALRSSQFCNLSTAVARQEDTWASLANKVRVAAIFGTLQSTLTRFRYLPSEWRVNCEEERLLGVDITGQMDCRMLQPSSDPSIEGYRRTGLEFLRNIASETNREWAAKLGIPESAAVTCVKPAGNSAQLFDCSSGLHPRYSRHYIRRFEAPLADPLTHLMIDSGVANVPKPGKEDSTALLEFPVESPAGAVTREDVDAIGQFRNYLAWKRHYTEHNPSVTIYVRDEEWEPLGREVWENFDSVGGVSFLNHDGGHYHKAPYEAISESEYIERMSNLPNVDFGKLRAFEKSDCTSGSQELACTGDKCEL